MQPALSKKGLGTLPPSSLYRLEAYKCTDVSKEYISHLQGSKSAEQEISQLIGLFLEE
jgi:hypothetical protein